MLCNQFADSAPVSPTWLRMLYPRFHSHASPGNEALPRSCSGRAGNAAKIIATMNSPIPPRMILLSGAARYYCCAATRQ